MNCDVFGELRLASLGPRPVSVLRNILTAARASRCRGPAAVVSIELGQADQRHLTPIQVEKDSTRDIVTAHSLSSV